MELLECEERKLRNDLIRSQIETAAQEWQLTKSEVASRRRRCDIILVFAAFILLLQLLPPGARPQPEVLAVALALIALALRSHLSWRSTRPPHQLH